MAAVFNCYHTNCDGDYDNNPGYNIGYNSTQIKKKCYTMISSHFNLITS